MCTLSSGMAAIYWSHADWFAMLLPTCSMIYVGCHLVERAYIFCTTVQYFEQNDGGNLSCIDGSTTTNSIALLLNAKVLFPYINTRDLASRRSVLSSLISMEFQLLSQSSCHGAVLMVHCTHFLAFFTHPPPIPFAHMISTQPLYKNTLQ